MQARRRSLYALSGRLWSLFILLLLVGTAHPPAPAATSNGLVNRWDAAQTDDAWAAVFHHTGLGQQGTLIASASGCRMDLAGSTPATIVLDRIIDQRFGSGGRISVYAGWPRNARGQVTGVRNQSRGPAPARISENKLGPTLVWTIGGCQQVCVRGIVLEYDMTIARGADAIAVTCIDTPIADGCAQVDACLTPAFRTEPKDSTIQYAGAIDQPGCTISEDGDGFCDTAGRRYVIVPGDRLDLMFKQRALIVCNNDVIGVMDWGYRLAATLGQAAHQITPEIREDVSVDLALKDDPNPTKRAQFARALVDVQRLLQLP